MVVSCGLLSMDVSPYIVSVTILWSKSEVMWPWGVCLVVCGLLCLRAYFMWSVLCVCEPVHIVCAWSSCVSIVTLSVRCPILCAGCIVVVELGAICKEFSTVATYWGEVIALCVPVLISVPFQMQNKLCSVRAENGAFRALDWHNVCMHNAIMLVKVRHICICCTAHSTIYVGPGSVLTVYVTCDCMYILVCGMAVYRTIVQLPSHFSKWHYSQGLDL